MKITKSIHVIYTCIMAMLLVGCMGNEGGRDARPPASDAAFDSAIADAGTNDGIDADTGGFCGFSTGGPCSTDADCYAGGCSGQVCQSEQEDPIITTCEWRECYDNEAYGLECGCVAGNCVWNRE